MTEKRTVKHPFICQVALGKRADQLINSASFLSNNLKKNTRQRQVNLDFLGEELIKKLKIDT